MFQLWNLIGRYNISNDPIHKFNESDDFFKLLISRYILAAAIELFKMKALDSIPSIRIYSGKVRRALDADSGGKGDNLVIHLWRHLQHPSSITPKVIDGHA